MERVERTRAQRAARRLDGPPPFARACTGQDDGDDRTRRREDDGRHGGGAMTRLAVLALVALVGACGPTLTAQSSPPPGRTAALEEIDDHYDLAISQGVAIAISCYHNGPCKDVVIATENASIADVKGAAFGILERHPYNPRATSTPAGVVIVGKAPGKTKVKLKTSDGSKTINVVVLAQPTQGAPAVRAVAQH